MGHATKSDPNAHLDRFNKTLSVFVIKATLIMDHAEDALITPSLILKELDVFVLILMQSSEQTPSNVFHALLIPGLMIFLHYVYATQDLLKMAKVVS